MSADAPTPGWLWSPPANRAPGWRVDPDNPGRQRWWTGKSWSLTTQPPPGTKNPWLTAAAISALSGIVLFVVAGILLRLGIGSWTVAILSFIGIGATPILNGVAFATHRRFGHRNQAEILFWITAILVGFAGLSTWGLASMALGHAGR